MRQRNSRQFSAWCASFSVKVNDTPPKTESNGRRLSWLRVTLSGPLRSVCGPRLRFHVFHSRAGSVVSLYLWFLAQKSGSVCRVVSCLARRVLGHSQNSSCWCSVFRWLSLCPSYAASTSRQRATCRVCMCKRPCLDDTNGKSGPSLAVLTTRSTSHQVVRSPVRWQPLYRRQPISERV